MTAPAAAVRRRRRRAAFALLLLLGLAAGLPLLLELGARLFWPLPPWFAELQQAGLYGQAPEGYALAPGYRGRLKIGATGRDTEVAVDALGLRGGAPAPAPGQVRVLCVGDSLVFGYGVEASETFAAQLGPPLTALLHRPVAGLNGGVPGYGTALTAAHLQRLVPLLGPDAVVFGVYLGNDFVDDRLPSCVYAGLFHQGAMAELVRTSWRVRLALRSRFWLWLESWIYAHRRDWSPLVRAFDPDASPGLLGLPPPPGTFAGLFLDVRDEAKSWAPGAPAVLPQALATLRQSLQAARAAAGARPLLVLVLPTFWHLRPQDWRQRLVELGFDPAQFGFGLLRQRVCAVAADLGLPVVDATDLLAAQADARACFIEDQGHLSPAGHRLVAKALAPLLAARLR